MTGLVHSLNTNREQVLAHSASRRNLEKAAASLAAMRSQIAQIESLIAETEGAPGLQSAAQEMLASARKDYAEITQFYEEAKQQAAETAAALVPRSTPDSQAKVVSIDRDDQETREARLHDQQLLDTMLAELKRHAMETGILETPMQVLNRIVGDHNAFVNGNGQFSRPLVDKLFLNRKPGEFNVEATVARLLADTIDLQARLDKVQAVNRVLESANQELATANQNFISNINTFKSIVQAAAARTIQGIPANEAPLGYSPLRKAFIQ